MLVVQDGTYELRAATSGLYLNSPNLLLHNRQNDDVLVFGNIATRHGKWHITRVGSGYTIKQVSSGLYCSLKENERWMPPLIVLRPFPTVWSVEFIDRGENTFRISWPVSNQCWTAPISEWLGPTLGKAESVQVTLQAWKLQLLGPNSESGSLATGVYAIQNKASETYVSLGPNEKTVECWPASKLEDAGVKMWVITPMGDGYTIRLQGTDKLVQESQISVSSVPAAWKIVATDSPLNGNSGYYQIFWADTDMAWDLAGFGKRDPGTPVQMMQNKDYQACRVFKFMS